MPYKLQDFLLEYLDNHYFDNWYFPYQIFLPCHNKEWEINVSKGQNREAQLDAPAHKSWFPLYEILDNLLVGDFTELQGCMQMVDKCFKGLAKRDLSKINLKTRSDLKKIRMQTWFTNSHLAIQGCEILFFFLQKPLKIQTKYPFLSLSLNWGWYS